VNDPLAPLLELRPEGLFAPAFGAFLDPPAPVARAFLSHAHSDHATAGHGEVWATPETVALYRRRHPEWSGAAREIPYREEVSKGGAVLRLHPAGHVLGSAQIWIGSEAESLLYTGDFKRRPARTTPPAEAPRAATLVTEATFGLPVFRFPGREELERRLVEACRAALDAGETPVLLAYALGKSQEAAAILASAGIPTVLHGAAWKLLPVYEAAGFPLPLSRAYETGPALPGEALVVPPSCVRTPVVQRIKKRRIVYLSGWAIREAARAEFDADVLLPFSDHADFDDLLAHVEETGASRVVATHGFAADFARILAARGRDAVALPEAAERGAEDA
jgi:Cft2 family RNA processing exonuclease